MGTMMSSSISRICSSIPILRQVLSTTGFGSTVFGGSPMNGMPLMLFGQQSLPPGKNDKGRKRCTRLGNDATLPVEK